MKREGKLLPKIVDYANIEKAHKKASENKSKSKIHIDKYKKNEVDNNYGLIDSFDNLSYKTSKYQFTTITDRGKEREIAMLPYYPDRIAHWAIMNVVQERFEKTYIRDTFAAIKDRGTDDALKRLNKKIKQFPEKKYCLKLDIKKFFPNIDKNILKNLFRKIIKDKRLLVILDEIVDSYPKNGIPIGNYTSQIFGNFYLTYFDHWIKEDLKVKMYFRYMDDIIICEDSKEELWRILEKIKIYLKENLRLEVKENYQVSPIYTRGVDFVGYKSYGYKITMRNKNKNKINRILNRIERKLNEGREITIHDMGQLSFCKSFSYRATGNYYRKRISKIYQRLRRSRDGSRYRMAFY